MSLPSRHRPGVHRAGAPRLAPVCTDRFKEPIDDLLGLFSTPPLPGLGTAAQREMARRLLDAGWSVFAEMFVPGLGREAWMDLFAVKNGVRVAIEIDRGRPKQSSLDKLRVWKADIRLACYLLDEPLVKPVPDGVYAAWIPSRPNTQQDSAFKGFGRNMRINPSDVPVFS